MADGISEGREMAYKVENLIESRVREMNTVAPVVIETIHEEDGIVQSVDVRLKHDPEGPLIPDARLVGLRGKNGHFLLPVEEGDVGLAFFSKFPFEPVEGVETEGDVDLLTDRNAYKLARQARYHAIQDCLVLPGAFFPSNDVPGSVPSGYDRGSDLLMADDEGRGVWVRDAEDDVVVGNLSGTLKRAATKGDSIETDGPDSTSGQITSGSPDVKIGE